MSTYAGVWDDEIADWMGFLYIFGLLLAIASALALALSAFGILGFPQSTATILEGVALLAIAVPNLWASFVLPSPGLTRYGWFAITIGVLITLPGFLLPWSSRPNTLFSTGIGVILAGLGAVMAGRYEQEDA